MLRRTRSFDPGIPAPLSGAGGAFALSAWQLAGGTAVFLANARFAYSEVSRGFYRSALWVLFPMAAASALLFDGGTRVAALIASAAMGGFLAAVYTQRPLLEWIGAAATEILSLVTIFSASLEACSGACGWVIGTGMAGLVFVGAVTYAMTLGHWYLNQARLPIAPLKHSTITLLVALIVSLSLGVVGRRELIIGTVPATLLSSSPVSYWWFWLVLMLSTFGLWLMVRSTVWSRSTQSATGLLYIAIVVVVTAQFVMNLLAIM